MEGCRKIEEDLITCQASLKEAQGWLSKWEVKWDEAGTKFVAECGRLQAEIVAERENVRKAEAKIVQARADAIAERDDALQALRQRTEELAYMQKDMAALREDHEQTVRLLNGAVEAAKSTLPCGHHHSMDDHAGGCLFCAALLTQKKVLP